VYEGYSKTVVAAAKATPGLAALPASISVAYQEFSSTSYKHIK